MLVEKFEVDIKEIAHLTDLHYYYEHYVNEDEDDLSLDQVWHGKGILDFILAVIKSPHLNKAITIFGTSANDLNEVIDDWNEEKNCENEDCNNTWLGDVGLDGSLICGHDILAYLWWKIKEVFSNDRNHCGFFH